MSIIKTKNLTKKFGDNIAVDNVSFDMKEGEIFGILGPNGAGKTTLISMLSTILLPDSGKAIIDGRNIANDGRSIRRIIGVLFQETILENDLSAYDNLDIHARLYGISNKERARIIKELLSLLSLEDVSNHKVSTFSGGMKRKLEIARALINKPKILILDEPTLGLDPNARRAVWAYLLNLKKKGNLTILMTTHYMDEADLFCDRIGIFNHGKFVATGKPKTLKKLLRRKSLEEVFIHCTRDDFK